MEHTAERLALLYRVSQAFNSSLDLATVLNTVMDEAIAVTRAERGFLMLREGDRLIFRTARGIDRQTIDEPQFQVSRGVIQRVAEEGRPLLTSDAQRDAQLHSRSSVIGLGLRAILCVPLRVKDATIGVVYLDNRIQAGIFTAEDLDLFNSIAASAAIAIENARLHLIELEQARIEREMQLARSMQQSLLPHSMPHAPGWEVGALWWPARTVAGDFYDFQGDTRRLGVTIGDVCDKGMPAALFMALSRTILRSTLGSSPSLAAAVGRANRLICADATDGMFVTMCHAQIDTLSGQVTYVNAGHLQPIFYHCSADRFEPLYSHNLALGLESEAVFSDQTLHLAEGDILLLVTDGATDITNAAGEAFGADRLREVIFSSRRLPATGMVATLETALHGFVGAAPQFVDDITLVLVKRVPLQ